MDAYRAFQATVLRRSTIGALAVSLILLITFSLPAALGFVLGALVSAVNFRLMALNSYKVLDVAPKQAQAGAYKWVGLRYAMMALALAVAASSARFELFATACGLFVSQAAVVSAHFWPATTRDAVGTGD